MGELKIKLCLNGGEEVLDLAGREDLSKRLFEHFLKLSHYFDLNDDGTSTGFAERLKPFEEQTASVGKGMSSFTISDESTEVIQELFSALENSPNLRWSLRGEGFSIEYFECGDDDSHEGAVECLQITAGGKLLETINDMIHTE